MRRNLLLSGLGLLLVLAGCGQKGDPRPRKELHAPKKPAQVSPAPQPAPPPPQQAPGPTASEVSEDG